MMIRSVALSCVAVVAISSIAAEPLVCPEPAKVETGSGSQGRAEFCATADGQLHGPAREWYPNGKQRTSQNWVHGKPEGAWVVWDEKGVKREEHSYRNGLLDGPEIYYHPNGNLQVETCWRSGKKDGPVVQWDETGLSIVIGQHLNDLMEGAWYFRHRDTGKVIRVNYQKGKDSSPLAADFPDEPKARLTCR